MFKISRCKEIHNPGQIALSAHLAGKQHKKKEKLEMSQKSENVPENCAIKKTDSGKDFLIHLDKKAKLHLFFKRSISQV